ncbi:MAG: signal peptidase I [Alphaproteobacteria bacterium]
MARKKPSGIWETAKTLIYAALIAVAIRTVAYEPFNIPSSSMVPTLLVGDYLFVSKFSYGYSRFSLPFNLPLIPDRIFFTPPQRGDVAVFKLPRDNETDYIKRIIGLPEDRIQVRGGILYINGEPVKRERIEDFVEVKPYGREVRYTQYVETLANGVGYRMLDLTPNGSLDNTLVYTVPPGHYFAMGDNRDNSLDSRVLDGVGFIPAENLIGRAEFIFFSTDGNARLWEIWKWPSATRFGRIFTGVM